MTVTQRDKTLDLIDSTALIDHTRTEFAIYGPVHLDVTDGERSLRFWRDLVGLEVMSRDGSAIHLGAGDRELVVLHPGARSRRMSGYTGLYHMALHLPSLTEYARVIARLQAVGAPPPTDFLEAFGVIIGDPDGIGLELAFETPERVGSTGIGPDGEPKAIDVYGRRHVPGPLDLAWLVGHVPEGGTQVPLPAGTIVGHLHLSVADLDRDLAFYRDVIGFTTARYAPGIGFADMSAGGPVGHRIALNTWQSRGAPQPPAGTAGMREFTLMPRSQHALEAIATRVEDAGRLMERRGDAIVAQDPSGSRMLLTASEGKR